MTVTVQLDTLLADLDVVLAGTSLLARLTALQVAQTMGAIGYASKALMDADLAHADGQIALVTNDATLTLNGTYRKSGASGTGSWVASAYDRVTALDLATVKLTGSKSTGTQKAPRFETTVGGDGLVLLSPDGYDRYLVNVSAGGAIQCTFLNSTRPAFLYRTGERPKGLVAYSRWDTHTYTDDLATSDPYSAWPGYNKLAADTGLIVFDGDSITWGSAVADPAATKVMRLLGGAYSFGIVAVPSAQLTDRTSAAPTAVDPFYSSARAKNICVIFAGTNDIKLGGQTGAQAYTRLQTYCAARRAVGWKVVVVTMLPRESGGGSTPFETNRISFNSSVRTNWASFADAIADVGADATIGGGTADTNTTNYRDAIHPTEVGQRIVAGYMYTAIQGLL